MKEMPIATIPQIFDMTYKIDFCQKRLGILHDAYFAPSIKKFNEAKTEEEKQAIMDEGFDIPIHLEYQTLSILLSYYWRGSFSECLFCFGELYNDTKNDKYLIK